VLVRFCKLLISFNYKVYSTNVYMLNVLNLLVKFTVLLIMVRMLL